MVCSGNFTRHDATHSGVGCQTDEAVVIEGSVAGVTCTLDRCLCEENKKKIDMNILVNTINFNNF